MFTLTVIAVGRLRDSYYREACDEYVRRLGAYAKVDVIETTAAALPDDPSEKQIQAALAHEGGQILKKIPRGAFVTALCVEGRSLTSAQLAENIRRAGLSGVSDAAFIIGSSFGLAEAVKARADLRLSMSAMTFPHALARVMLLEQLYRAMNINAGGKYDK